MIRLIDATVTFAGLLTPERVEAVAGRFRSAHAVYEALSVEALVQTPEARTALVALTDAWRASGASGEFVAGLMVGAAHARQRAAEAVSVELVWTGPTTTTTPTRRTEQVLIDVVRRAVKDLFVVSFVAYDVADVVRAFIEAVGRGVEVRFLLESSSSHGGSLDVDPIANVRRAVPGAKLYAWTAKGDLVGGRVHAKVAVADGRVALVSSANLTRYAMGKNMEAGVLIDGGHVPADLRSHLRALVETKVVVEV